MKITNSEIDFFTVVVVYNTKVEDSITLARLKKITNHSIQILVVDNSTRHINNQDVCNDSGWMYISMNGNAGLSKAYNAALDHLKGKNGIIVWFDDDTEVTQEYFDVLKKEVQQEETVDIFVPMIRGQDGRFWSPNEYHYLKNKQLVTKYQEIGNQRFNAINSCTAVRSNVYDNYRYTEKLFLDQVDHQFFEDQRNLKRKFKKMDVIICHNFSTKSKMNSIENVKTRYAIMIPDFLTFCRKTNARYMLGWVKIIGWGVRESIRYGRPEFLTWCIKTAYQSDLKQRKR